MKNLIRHYYGNKIVTSVDRLPNGEQFLIKKQPRLLGNLINGPSHYRSTKRVDSDKRIASVAEHGLLGGDSEYPWRKDIVVVGPPADMQLLYRQQEPVGNVTREFKGSLEDISINGLRTVARSLNRISNKIDQAF